MKKNRKTYKWMKKSKEIKTNIQKMYDPYFSFLHFVWTSDESYIFLRKLIRKKKLHIYIYQYQGRKEKKGGENILICELYSFYRESPSEVLRNSANLSLNCVAKDEFVFWTQLGVNETKSNTPRRKRVLVVWIRLTNNWNCMTIDEIKHCKCTESIPLDENTNLWILMKNVLK